MQAGEVVANVTLLNECFRLSELDELVARKREGAEKTLLAERELATHGDVLDQLEAKLVEAHAKSQLPETASTGAALEDLVIRLRLERLRATHGDVSA